MASKKTTSDPHPQIKKGNKDKISQNSRARSNCAINCWPVGRGPWPMQMHAYFDLMPIDCAFDLMPIDCAN
jgi:hypothetical protein